MIKILRQFFRNSDATAAVEAAIFLPVYLVLTLGVTDVGTGMFVEMTVNAATQAGAAYAVIHYTLPGSPTPGVCASMTAACLSGIEHAMNDATGNPSFCTGTVCSASFTACADTNGGICFTVSANIPYLPILPAAAYSWAKLMTASSTTTVRVPTS
jgi:hypothetical protein